MSWVGWSRANSLQSLFEDSEGGGGALAQLPPTSLGDEVAPAASHELTPEQLVDYAKSIGIDEKRVDLFWIAEHGLTAPVPKNWNACVTPDPTEGAPAHHRRYYFNTKSGESMWEHPLDKYFRELAKCFTGPKVECENKDVEVQTGHDTAHKGVQAMQEVTTTGTQRCAEKRTSGVNPMPGVSTTMTASMNDAVTATTPTIQPAVAATESIAVGPSYPTPVSRRGPVRVASLHDFKLPQSSRRQETKQVVQPPPEPDEITKQMISEFQQCLSQHKKEVLDVVLRQSQAKLPDVPPVAEAEEEGAADQPLDPLAFPTEPGSGVAGNHAWGSPQWLFSYGILGVGHAAICLCVMYVLPLVLVEQPLVEDAVFV